MNSQKEEHKKEEHKKEEHKKVDLSIIVPVNNEGGNIEPLIEEIHSALDGHLAFEMLFVDDGSTDGTYALLSDRSERDSCLRFVRHPVQCGVSPALRSGVIAASAPVVATLDGDGQNDPADLLLLYKAFSSDKRPARLCLIAGKRVHRRDKWIRKASSKIANKVRGWLLKDNTPDSACGIRIFLRQPYLQLPYFDNMHRFLPALFKRQGLDTLSLETNHRPRLSGEPHFGINNRLWTGIVDMLGVWWLQKRAKHPEILRGDEIEQ